MDSKKIPYPKTVKTFRKQFASEAACVNYLIQSRWPDGFVCRKCRKETSPTSGTLMHRTHVPLQDWFWAAYLVSTVTPGISAVQLQRQLGLGSCRTAWFMLHRLRKGMVNDSRTKLAGVVEADEAFVGGPAKEKRGRGVAKASNKSMIAGTVEVVTYTTKSGVTKEMAGRLRLAIIENGNEETIGGFLRSNVDKGAKVRSDGWKGYSKLALSGYEHEIRIVGPSKRAHLVAPHIHRVFGNLKTWLRGTHHGVEPKYLASYLQEFVFRFNRRQTPMAAFQTLLGITASKSPITLTELRS